MFCDVPFDLLFIAHHCVLSVIAPPAWTVVGTEFDRKVCGVALVKGAWPLTLLSREETHKFLDAKHAAGVKSMCLQFCCFYLFCILLRSRALLFANAAHIIISSQRAAVVGNGQQHNGKIQRGPS